MKFKSKLIALLIVACFFPACIKKGVDLYRVRWERKIEKQYGPMEKWGGAKCDKEIVDITYAPRKPGTELLKLDVYYNDHEGLQPIVVNIHGGGWALGDKRDSSSLFRSRYIANSGYVVANVNYRMLPGYQINTQIEDVMGAVIWIKEHAADYGGDPTRVGVTGGSAGGHLAAMVAWGSGDPYFKPTGHTKSKYDSDVLAAAPFYGGFDLGKTLKAKNFMMRFTGIKSIRKYKKGPERDEYLRHIAPINHVSPDTPPTLFVCGDKDNFGLYPESVDAKKRLRKAGVDTGLFIAKGGTHGFDIEYGAEISQAAMKATVAWFDKYLKQ